MSSLVSKPRRLIKALTTYLAMLNKLVVDSLGKKTRESQLPPLAPCPQWCLWSATDAYRVRFLVFPSDITHNKRGPPGCPCILMNQ